jgi:L-amino acid N-acyltransferase YncA
MLLIVRTRRKGGTMLPVEIKNHRDVVTLKDGVRVLLRPMVIEDRERLAEFFNAVSEDDMRYMRHNVKDPAVLDDWCKNLNYEKSLPIVAVVKERLVGSTTLHFFEGPKRHVAEVRMFLAKDFRQRGLGMKMLRALMEFARKQDIRILVAEVIAEKTKVVRAFEALGFVSKCTLEDYFMLPDGDSCDVVFLTMDLKPKSDEF